MSKQQWHQYKEAKGALFGIKTLLFLEKLIGQSIIRLLISIIMFCYWCFAHNARSASQDYLQILSQFKKAQIATSESKSPNLSSKYEEKLSSLQHFISFGNALFDKLLCWSGKITLQEADIHQPEFQLNDSNHQKGVLILGSHLGNIEVCRALAELETTQKIHVLMHTEQTQNFNAILKSLNPQSHINLVSINNITPETMIFLKSALDQGDYVALLADRLPISNTATAPNNVTEVHFLGRKAHLPKGPFILALLLNVPTYFMVGLKEQKRYQIYLQELHFPKAIKRGERASVIQNLTEQYLSHLTYYCLLAPLQWFNFYDFWLPNEKKDNKYE